MEVEHDVVRKPLTLFGIMLEARHTEYDALTSKEGSRRTTEKANRRNDENRDRPKQGRRGFVVLGLSRSPSTLLAAPL